ncbi:MAG: hypothetical protein IJ007_07580 [Oscillospiraceae bacterium]|nr:hypothetical protein [Oscillospiraceae bacterium]
MIKFSSESPLRHKLAFTAVCIALNIAGRSIALNFGLPFWLDTAGTCLSACILGPVYGAVTGLISNLAIGVFDLLSVLYFAINIGIGIIVGIASRRKMCDDIFNTLCLSIITGCFAFICSTPLNCIFNNGLTGNKWGDALFHMLENYRISVPLRSACGQAFIDIPDKVVTLVIVFIILKFMKDQGLVTLKEESID